MRNVTLVGVDVCGGGGGGWWGWGVGGEVGSFWQESDLEGFKKGQGVQAAGECDARLPSQDNLGEPILSTVGHASPFKAAIQAGQQVIQPCLPIQGVLLQSLCWVYLPETSLKAISVIGPTKVSTSTIKMVLAYSLPRQWL